MILSERGSLNQDNGGGNGWRRGHRFQVHTFEAGADQTFMIDVGSGNGRGGPNFFDTYIFVIHDDTNTLVAQNDDDPRPNANTLNSHCTIRTGSRTGRYTVLVTTYERDAQGDYTIRVVQGNLGAPRR